MIMAIDVASRGQGIVLAQSSTDLLALFGTVTAGLQVATGAAQPSGNAQAAVARGQQSGAIFTLTSTQSPSAVAQITAAEQNFTLQSGTTSPFLLAAGDVCFINKPTAQAGLGIGNIRVGSSNTLAVNFTNIPAGGNITPTASQGYTVVAIRGLPVLSPVLSPVAVAANSTVEQTFAVTGLAVGQLVQVSKPTAQAGLDIAGCRVVSNNVLGITFINPTAAPITPTASETYTVAALFGLDATNNDVVYGFNAGTIGVIGAGVVITGAPVTVSGVLATDIPIGPAFKPTTSAAATNAAAPIQTVIAANTISPLFAGIGTGATPTASEVYSQKVHRLNPLAPMVNYSQSLAPVSVAALTTVEQTFTVTGLVASSVAWVNKPTAQAGLGIVGVRVSALNTLAITYSNTSAAAIVPPTETYVIGNFQHVGPGAGNWASQSVVAVMDKVTTLTNAIRAALVAIAGIAGA
jgi:hypothetical protein